MSIYLEQKIPTQTEIEFLSDGLTASLPAGMPHIEPFGFFVRDTETNIIAGATGNILFGSIYTDLLWVSPALRNAGHGSALMEAVEKLGREKKCVLATVNTFSFQALPFYLSLGYKIDLERPGYTNDSINYYLSKLLYKLNHSELRRPNRTPAVGSSPSSGRR